MFFSPSMRQSEYVVQDSCGLPASKQVEAMEWSFLAKPGTVWCKRKEFGVRTGVFKTPKEPKRNLNKHLINNAEMLSKTAMAYIE